MTTLLPENPNYYAVIPADVRYSKKLEPNAKLLYGEISALCNREGYCWANNRYFSELYGVDSRTIQRWLQSLQKENFIVLKEEDDSGKPKRYIYLSHAFQIISTRQKCHGGMTKMSRGGDKNVVHNNTSNNTYTNPPLSSPPKKSFDKKSANKSLRSEEEEISIFEFLKDTTLSPKEQRRLSKDYSEDQVRKALEISKNQSIKKSLMGLLINILDNPDKWPDMSNSKPMSHEQQLAVKYNQKLAKIHPKLAKQNEELIFKSNVLRTLDNVDKNEISQISLKNPEAKKEINACEKYLDKVLSKGN